MLWLSQEVEGLCEMIKASDVRVEVESPNTNLAETLNKIRDQYDKVAKKNQMEADAWYQRKV